MTDDMYTRVAELLVDRFDAPAAAIKPQTRFEELNFDSIALVEFALEAQRAFGVELAEGEMRADQTIEEVAALLTKLSATTE
jgi:acyl carrier protein